MKTLTRLFRRDPQAQGAQIADNPLLSGPVVFDGPRRIEHDGSVSLELGPYIDGDGEALYRLYTPGSMWSGLIVGGTGTGTSRIAENIVISATSAGDTTFWFADPQHGASSPALASHAARFADLDGVPAMAADAGLLVATRGQENAAKGWAGFTPSAQRPGLLIVIEECHRVFADPDAANTWMLIAREGRKVGVGLLLITQHPRLEAFGGNEVLRSTVMAGNTIVLRTGSGLVPGLDVDLGTLPKIPGYAHLGGPGDARTAPFRNRDTSAGPGAAHWLASPPIVGVGV